ncbi:MAG TPA: glycoside hydrolase family 16 protein [Fimbriimonas sp.]|nr:glycoside hydrolase family 16 protein [Fimbriimonas sp.]
MTILTTFALLLAAAPGAQETPDNPTKGKHMVWQDDFRKSGLPDSAKWNYEKGLVRNHEAQYYTENRLENAHVDHHMLTIEARKEVYENAEYTSAALESKLSWDHGYFEIKAKIPTGRGAWPAIWFLGNSIREKGPAYVGWPACGEIDLMENVGFDPEKVHFNIHVPKNSTAQGSVASSHIEVPKVWEGWHVYGLDYQPHRLDLYFDGKKVMSYLDDGSGEAQWPFDRPQFLILNLAIGGDWGGQKGIDPAAFPSKFQIAYVKVYQ